MKRGRCTETCMKKAVKWESGRITMHYCSGAGRYFAK